MRQSSHKTSEKTREHFSIKYASPQLSILSAASDVHPINTVILLCYISQRQEIGEGWLRLYGFEAILFNLIQLHNVAFYILFAATIT